LYGSNKQNPHGDLTINESHLHQFISNKRGTASVAHFDAPDCGSTELFISVTDNPHLDTASGGFVVFAQVDPEDADSFKTMDAIEDAVKQKGKVELLQATIV